ncbi:MAG: hypothetical protein F6K21_10320 [Symploca sp. SIO2D2]|nr:hypothetical protein [Symploca sp. SIO2D2]NER25119.1 hypothetical protein [Symploca sp. SIO1C2]NER47152.1 hypothetical protein [Symploca sp. SIO1A3]
MSRLFFVSGLLLFSCTACFLSGSSHSTSDDTTTPEATLSTFQCIPGTEQMISSVLLDHQGKGLSSKRGYHGETHNYSFFDKSQETVTFTKLLPNNDYVIKRIIQLTEAGVPNPQAKNSGIVEPAEFSCTDSPVIKWLLYLVVNQDTNGDDQLDSTDIPLLAMSDVSGKSYTELIPGVQRILNIIMKDSQQLMVIYKKDNQYHFSMIDLLQREVTLTEQISI